MAETVLYKYAINLESYQKKSEVLISLKDFNVDERYKIYQSEVKLGRGKVFYRLRLGFFRSKKEANKVALKFKSKYSKLWVDRLHKQDRKTLDSWRKSLKRRKNTTRKRNAAPPFSPTT